MPGHSPRQAVSRGRRMITIEYRKNQGRSIKVEGHANSAPYGEDLVCAAASVLLYTLIQNMTILESQGCVRGLKTVERQGNGEVSYEEATDENAEAIATCIFSTIWNGYMVLEKNFPDFVKCVFVG